MVAPRGAFIGLWCDPKGQRLTDKRIKWSEGFMFAIAEVSSQWTFAGPYLGQGRPTWCSVDPKGFMCSHFFTK